MAAPPVERLSSLSAEARAELLSEAAALAGIGIYRWELGGQTYWSDPLFGLLGIDAQTPTPPETYLDAVHPDDAARVRAAFEACIRDQRVEPLEYRIVRPDGEVRYLRGIGSSVRHPGGVALVGAILDVTDRRQAELDAQLYLHSLEEAQRMASTGSFFVDPQSRKIRWTKGLYRISGVEPGTTITPEVGLRLTHPDDRDRQLAWWGRIARGETDEPIRVRAVRADGEERVTLTHAGVVEVGGDSRLVGTTIDMTDRVVLEERLREAAKMEAVGTLAAGLAHDFNNFLTVIGGNVEVALRSPQKADRVLTDVMQAVDRCASLTRQLLAFARQQPARPAVVDLSAVVEHVGVMLRRLLGTENVLALELPDQPVPIEADRTHLEQIVVNLATNARDAMPAGGRIEIRVSVEDHAELGCRAGVVTVSDEGEGIAPDDLPRVFDPYFTTKKPGQGTGLGLASVWGTARQNRGTVDVSSAPGGGARFRVSFPLVDRALDVDRVARAVTSDARGTILVVEDMEAVRRSIAAGLRALGYDTIEAGDGVAALELLDARTEPVHGIVTDAAMPRMGGVELAREILRRTPSARVVIVTGHLPEEISSEERLVVVQKPFRIEALVEALRSMGDDP